MEILCRVTKGKFDLAAALFEASPPELAIELDALRVRYALSTAHLFHRAAVGECSRQEARAEHHRISSAEGFLSDLDRLVGRLQRALDLGADPPAPATGLADSADEETEALGAPRRRRRVRATQEPRGTAERRERRALRALFDQYAEHGAALAAAEPPAGKGDRYNWCYECGREMVIRADTSELECPSCRQCRPLYGTVFDDAQFYNQEGQKAKSGSFNPNRHFHFWMDRILAREPEEELGDKDDPENLCGEALFAALRALIRRDNKILRLLGVDDVRAMLKVLGKTELNKNVPLILKKLTGVGPPPLSESLCQRVEKLFSKAIEVGERVRPLGRTNRSYYPFYIYKILDALLPPDDYDNRRALYYIYMQGKETLDKNDSEWWDICAELPEITWVATDRSQAQLYWQHR